MLSTEFVTIAEHQHAILKVCRDQPWVWLQSFGEEELLNPGRAGRLIVPGSDWGSSLRGPLLERTVFSADFLAHAHVGDFLHRENPFCRLAPRARHARREDKPESGHISRLLDTNILGHFPAPRPSSRFALWRRDAPRGRLCIYIPSWHCPGE